MFSKENLASTETFWNFIFTVPGKTRFEVYTWKDSEASKLDMLQTLQNGMDSTRDAKSHPCKIATSKSSTVKPRAHWKSFESFTLTSDNMFISTSGLGKDTMQENASSTHGCTERTEETKSTDEPSQSASLVTGAEYVPLLQKWDMVDKSEAESAEVSGVEYDLEGSSPFSSISSHRPSHGRHSPTV